MHSSLQEVVQSNFPVLTMDTMQSDKGDLSSLKDFFLPEYEVSCRKSGIAFPDWMSELKANLIHPGPNKYLIVDALMVNDQSWFANDTMSLGTFAMIDIKEEEEDFSNLIRKFLPEYEARELRENSPFDFKLLWMMDRNFLIDKIVILLAGFTESGLQKYWHLHYRYDQHYSWVKRDIRTVKRQYKMNTEKNINSVVDKIFELVSNGFGKLYSSVHINSLENGIEADADKPVSLSAVWFIWLLTFSSYFMIAFLYVMENIFHRLHIK